VNLEFVHPSPDGWVAAFSKLPSFLLAFDFQNAQPESATTCHHRTEQKDPPRRKVLLKIAPVLVHQAPLRLGHVLHEGRAPGDQFEEVVLLFHGRENSSSRLQQCPEFRELPHLEILPARNAYHLQAYQ
jgi:hypothetical protein